jgi:hypothetical protein
MAFPLRCKPPSPRSISQTGRQSPRRRPQETVVGRRLVLSTDRQRAGGASHRPAKGLLARCAGWGSYRPSGQVLLGSLAVRCRAVRPSGPARAHRHGDAAVPGDENDRDLRAGLRQLTLEIQAALTGHANIRHEAGRPLRSACRGGAETEGEGRARTLIGLRPQPAPMAPAYVADDIDSGPPHLGRHPGHLPGLHFADSCRRPEGSHGRWVSSRFRRRNRLRQGWPT